MPETTWRNASDWYSPEAREPSGFVLTVAQTRPAIGALLPPVHTLRHRPPEENSPRLKERVAEKLGKDLKPCRSGRETHRFHAGLHLVGGGTNGRSQLQSEFTTRYGSAALSQTDRLTGRYKYKMAYRNATRQQTMNRTTASTP